MKYYLLLEITSLKCPIAASTKQANKTNRNLSHAVCSDSSNTVKSNNNNNTNIGITLGMKWLQLEEADLFIQQIGKLQLTAVVFFCSA